MVSSSLTFGLSNVSLIIELEIHVVREGCSDGRGVQVADQIIACVHSTGHFGRHVLLVLSLIVILDRVSLKCSSVHHIFVHER